MLSPSGKGDDALGALSVSANEADTIIWSPAFWGKAADATVVDGGGADVAVLDSGATMLDGGAADAGVVDGRAASASLNLLAPSFSSTL